MKVRGLKTITTVLFLLQGMLVFPDQTLAINWDEFSGAVNKGFHENQVFGFDDFILLMVIILVGLIVVAIFRAQDAKKTNEMKRSFAEYKERTIAASAGKQQHRQWFRLRTRAEFSWILASEAENAKPNKYHKDQLVDISGGGLSFVTAEELQSDDEIVLILDTGGAKPLNIKGRVIRTVEDKNGEDVKYTAAIQFIQLTPGQTDQIVNWIIKRQRETMRNQEE
ncbi:PilZ domain-containing protein [Syntrophomonas palmitatica]|uniref:PilZ domain-containing protein n=1 Tax=Syntrophomonas palmitatica TaxID=402877 RepID=UPI0006D2B0E9|nr:PilZ domain-containing protein [Syntrophomonas palmitatica]